MLITFRKESFLQYTCNNEINFPPSQDWFYQNDQMNLSHTCTGVVCLALTNYCCDWIKECTVVIVVGEQVWQGTTYSLF